jgi:prepilin-type N-terminal cleavage/methylation domain-containing protein
MLVTRHSPHVTGRRPAAFTLIELLIVIAIIAILVGLAFPAVQGALASARKAEVRGMANQIKLAISSYYAEYGTYPTNATTDINFLRAMTGETNVTTIPNRRGIRFLEAPGKFTNSAGIVTPPKFYKTGQSNFSIVVDTNYDGKISVPGALTNSSGSVAVWVRDPQQTNQLIGTW